MKAAATVILLWLLGVAKRRILAWEGKVVVSCQQDVVTLRIFAVEELAKRLNATVFLVGDINGHSCTVSDGMIRIYHPFRMCGTKIMVSSSGAIISNTIWAWTSAGVAVKYADVQCRYGSHFEDISEPQHVALEGPSSSSLRPELQLCKSPMYCPSHACPHTRSMEGAVIYFERDVMHLSIRLTEMKSSQSYSGPLGATITRLVLSCGVDSLSSAKEYFSVVDGCRLYGNAFENRGKVLYTQVDYNVQSDTVCLSVDTPPSKECSNFYLHGTVIQCNKTYEKKCEDYSGSMCFSPGAAKSDFVYGPIYVFDGNQTQDVISYSTEATTQLSFATSSDLNLFAAIEGEDHDSIFDLPTSTVSKLRPPYQDAVPTGVQLDFDRALPSTTSQNTVTLEMQKRPTIVEKLNPKLSSAGEITGPEQIAEEKVLNDPTYSVSSDTTADIDTLGPGSHPRGRAPEVLSNPEHSSSETNRRRVASKWKPFGKVGNPERPNEKNRAWSPNANFTVEKAILDAIDEGDLFPPSQNESGLSGNRNAPTDNQTPTTNLQESSLEQSRLGRYNVGSGRDGFTWGAISALGVFLLVSIGLLTAWAATKRRKARTLKSRRS